MYKSPILTKEEKQIIKLSKFINKYGIILFSFIYSLILFIYTLNINGISIY